MKHLGNILLPTAFVLASCGGGETERQLSDNMITVTRQWSADQGDGYYMNPILKGDWGDPTILRDGEDYYMTTHTATISTPSMLIWHSRDLVNWEPLCYALNIDLGAPVWAADFIKHGNMYYMYLPVPEKGTVYVITAPSPEGPWSEPTDVGVSGIDPGHIATPDGKRYLHVDAGYMVELSPDGLKAVTPKKKVYDGWQYPEDWIVECFCLESPKLTYRDGWYYLTVAQGGTAGPPTGHMIASSRSRTPYGPWEHSPYNPVVKTAGISEKWASMGHGSLVDTPDGDWYIVFHAYDNGNRNMGRQVLMLPVEWTDDGWFRIPPGTDPESRIRIPSGGSKISGKMPVSDDFGGNGVGVQWKCCGGDIRERAFVADSVFCLKAEGNPGEFSTPVVVDPMNDWYQAEVTVLPEENVTVGLALYAGNGCIMGLELENGMIYQRRAGLTGRVAITETSADDVVRFRLTNWYGNLLYWYSTDDGAGWKRIDFVSNIIAFGGNTVRPGLYASGSGTGKFRNFVCDGIE